MDSTRPNTGPDAPVPAAFTHPQIDFAALPADLRAAAVTAYELAAQTRLAVVLFDTLLQLDQIAAGPLGGPGLPDCPFAADDIARALAEIDRLTAGCRRVIPPVRQELILCRAGWDPTLVAATNAHDAALAHAQQVRRQFDELVRTATGDFTHLATEYRPPSDLVRAWPAIRARARLVPPAFDRRLAAGQLEQAVCREATLAASRRGRDGAGVPGGTAAGGAPPVDRPVWDKLARRLRFRGAVVRDYSRKRAEKQERILDAFHSAGWPPAVQPGFDGRALKDAIDSFNSTVTAGTLRLTGDGTGRGVQWQTVTTAGDRR